MMRYAPDLVRFGIFLQGAVICLEFAAKNPPSSGMRRLSHPVRVPTAARFLEFDNSDLWRVPGYQRNLPHRRLEGATYFVTFRLFDSIPESVLFRWEQNREAWLHGWGIEASWQKDDPKRYWQALQSVPKAERQAFERIQARRYFGALDRSHGCCALKNDEARSLVQESLLHFHGSRVWAGDFVIMPNHVHVIVQPFEGVRLEEWLYSIKRFSGTRIQQWMSQSDKKRQTWQSESAFDRVIRDRAELDRTRQYIADNPRRLREGEFTLHRAEWLNEALVREGP